MSYQRIDGGSEVEESHNELSSTRSSLSSILENINNYEKTPDEESHTSKQPEEKRVYKRRLLIMIAASVLALFVLVPVCALRQNGGYLSPSSSFSAERALSLKDMRKGMFSASTKTIRWIEPKPGSEESTGDFIIAEKDGYYLSSWANRDNRTLLLSPVITANGQQRRVLSYEVNADRTKIVVSTDYISNWRHSSFSNYWIVDAATGDVEPVHTEDPEAFLSLAVWSPVGDKIAYVYENNIYIRSLDGPIQQITQDGGKEIFYGRPDWVYEEEVFAGDKALWWSPSGDFLAFLRTNDSSVPEFPIPYFIREGKSEGDAYPEMRYIKYPKPGYDNPIVGILFLDVSSGEYFDVPVEENPPVDDIITEVMWTDAAQVVVRLSNRESDTLKVSVVDAKSRTGQIVRVTDLRDVDGGWVEVEEHSAFVPADPDNGRPEPGYIDTVVINDANHLAYFSPVTSSEPKSVLTSGKWEVDGGVASFDKSTNTVYLIATKKSSIERHLYKVQLDGTGLTSVTNETEDGVYSAEFSGDSRFALLNYKGPDVPWQKVIDLHIEQSVNNGEFVEKNNELAARLQKYALPTIRYGQIKVASKGEEDAEEDIYANTVEYLPANFTEGKRYPVLFYVYGGPGSQMIKKTYGYDFQKIMTSHEVIVVTCDGRGTGFMGRKFRTIVRDKLGDYEVRDQISAAKEWASKSYVDEDRIAIWGWSYGGYMTLKTLEADGGNTFTYGMAVAPPTDWRYYDSIYTERYMHTPEHNSDGYWKSSVQNVTSIGQSERFLVMHGTGDDNVHMQNTMVLLDKLDKANVENYDVHVFPDSDHSIYFNNANAIVYDKLEHWILDAFSGQYKTRLS